MAELVDKDAETAAKRKSMAWRWLVAAALSCVVIVGFFDRISIAVLFREPLNIW